ncbi:MAG: hypothetical protein DYG98_18490 [Haliscomenobacteraceae bacterium CHB4]|nr:hypothetical protein [Haliscomenobacteraceae bacterium CHB4]
MKKSAPLYHYRKQAWKHPENQFDPAPHTFFPNKTILSPPERMFPGRFCCYTSRRQVFSINPCVVY